MYSYNILSKLFYISQDSPSGIRRIEDAISGRHYHIIVAKKDDVAGFKDSDGYWRVSVSGKNLVTSRVVWVLSGNNLKSGFVIDHIDGDKDNNILSNFRIVPICINSRNKRKRITNSSGTTGVYKYTQNRNGKQECYWIASWCENFKKRTKAFSVNKYGEDKAFKLAVELRNIKITELNASGYDYSERHGL